MPFRYGRDVFLVMLDLEEFIMLVELTIVCEALARDQSNSFQWSVALPSRQAFSVFRPVVSEGVECLPGKAALPISE